MSKLTRKNIKVFGGNSSNTGTFGSAQAGSGVLTTDIESMQSLSAWSNGMASATIGGQKLLPQEEMEAALRVATYGLANIYQDGIPVYDSLTTYYTTSIVRQDNTTILYKSLVDNNVGNVLTDNTKWEKCGDLSLLNETSIIPVGTSTTASNDATLTGTVTATAGSTTVTGSSTYFTTECPTGSTIVINGTPCLVSAVASDTSLTLSQTYANVTYTGTAYKANLIKTITGLNNFSFQDGAQIDIIFTNPNFGLTDLGFSINGTTYLCTKGGNVISDTNVAYFPAGYKIRFTYNLSANKFDLQNVEVDSYINGASWYRVWSDGWTEQGGYKTDTIAPSPAIFTLLKSFKNTDYSILFRQDYNASSNSDTAQWAISDKQLSNFTCPHKCNKYWEAKGY